jgi:sterol desaturase/sphingolipid hydroxylase (fatty acid hydroxylase superfamily)
MLSRHLLLTQVVHLAVWLVALSALFIPLERLLAVRSAGPGLRKSMLQDVVYYYISSFVPIVIVSFLNAWLIAILLKVMPGIVTEMVAELPYGVKALLAFVLGETGFYWGHRWSHEVPFLWRFHAIHHSAEEVDYLVNTRAHPVDMIFSRFCGITLQAIFGLSLPAKYGGNPTLAAITVIIGTCWGFFLHANARVKFGFMEKLISTPHFHHWHHVKTGPINKNYASTLPWLDIAFGTFYLPEGWPQSYGIDEPHAPGILRQLADPFLGVGPGTEQRETAEDSNSA